MLYESCVRDARAYVRLATDANGPLPAQRPAAYPWGVALQDMQVGQLEVGCRCGDVAAHTHILAFALLAAPSELPAMPVVLQAYRQLRLCRLPTPSPSARCACCAVQDKAPDARIINLETAVTTNDEPWPRKGINYRMHPGGGRVCSALGTALGTAQATRAGTAVRGGR